MHQRVRVRTDAHTDTLFSEGVKMHNAIADRARRYQHGLHPYLGCTTLCTADYSLHGNLLHWPYILQPLWGDRIPPKISIANFGCREFDDIDPLFQLLSLPTQLTGICIDLNVTALAEARKRLKPHAVNVVEAMITPYNVQALLQEHAVIGTIDFLKMDIDSFDGSILSAALDIVSAKIVIVEFDRSFPPPFQYALHYSERYSPQGPNESTGCQDEIPMKPDDFKCTVGPHPGHSLSYLVTLLSKGYFLYKIEQENAIFINKHVAPFFTTRDEVLTFPIDEWACYMQTPMLKPWLFTKKHVREWMLESDIHLALQRMWGNITRLSSLHNWSSVPFTLGIASGGSAPLILEDAV